MISRKAVQWRAVSMTACRYIAGIVIPLPTVAHRGLAGMSQAFRRPSSTTPVAFERDPMQWAGDAMSAPPADHYFIVVSDASTMVGNMMQTGMTLLATRRSGRASRSGRRCPPDDFDTIVDVVGACARSF